MQEKRFTVVPKEPMDARQVEIIEAFLNTPESIATFDRVFDRWAKPRLKELALYGQTTWDTAELDRIVEEENRARD